MRPDLGCSITRQTNTIHPEPGNIGFLIWRFRNAERFETAQAKALIITDDQTTCLRHGIQHIEIKCSRASNPQGFALVGGNFGSYAGEFMVPLFPTNRLALV